MKKLNINKDLSQNEANQEKKMQPLNLTTWPYTGNEFRRYTILYPMMLWVPCSVLRSRDMLFVEVTKFCSS